MTGMEFFPVYAVAEWSDADGSTYRWPQGTRDNRRSRVLARITRFGIPCDPTTLVITHLHPTGADGQTCDPQ